MSLRPTWWSVTGVRTPHRRPDARRLIGTVPHKHTIPAPGAAVELGDPVTLALICVTASQSFTDAVRASTSTHRSANRPTRR